MCKQNKTKKMIGSRFWWWLLMVSVCVCVVVDIFFSHFPLFDNNLNPWNPHHHIFIVETILSYFSSFTSGKLANLILVLINRNVMILFKTTNSVFRIATMLFVYLCMVYWIVKTDGSTLKIFVTILFFHSFCELYLYFVIVVVGCCY